MNNSVNKFADWLERFGKAWSDLDADTASRLFSNDVEYYESSLRDPCKSWDEVRDLWSVVPNNQKDVSFKYQIIASLGNLCVANWQVTRTLLPQLSRQSIDGIFVIKLNEKGLCNYFKQWRTSEESLIFS